MSASMAEGIATILEEHVEVRIFGPRCRCGKALDVKDVAGSLAAHQAEQLAANGYGRLEDGTALKAQAWRDGYYTGKRDYAGSIMGGLSISTPNPHEWRPE